MQTTEEVLMDITESYGEDYKKNTKMISIKLAQIAMKEYAKQVVDECVSKFECSIQEAEGRIEADENYTAYIEPKSVIAVKEQIS